MIFLLARAAVSRAYGRTVCRLAAAQRRAGVKRSAENAIPD